MTSLNYDPNDITRLYIRLMKDALTGYYRIIDKIGVGGMGKVYLAGEAEKKRSGILEG